MFVGGGEEGLCVAFHLHSLGKLQACSQFWAAGIVVAEEGMSGDGDSFSGLDEGV